MAFVGFHQVFMPRSKYVFQPTEFGKSQTQHHLVLYYDTYCKNITRCKMVDAMVDAMVEEPPSARKYFDQKKVQYCTPTAERLLGLVLRARARDGDGVRAIVILI